MNLASRVPLLYPERPHLTHPPPTKDALQEHRTSEEEGPPLAQGSAPALPTMTWPQPPGEGAY